MMETKDKKKISGDYTVLTMRSAVYNNVIIERKRNHKEKDINPIYNQMYFA